MSLSRIIPRAPRHVARMSARCIAHPALLACTVIITSSCVTAKTVVEIPPCADRVDVVGEATRASPRIFVLDHGLELPLSRTAIVVETRGLRERRELVSTEPDVLRLFAGGISFLAGVLVWSDGVQALRRTSLPRDDALARQALGGALVAGGVFAAATGWHPPQRSVSFPDACNAPPPPP